MSIRSLLVLGLLVPALACAGALDPRIASLAPGETVRVLVLAHATGLPDAGARFELARARVARGNERSHLRKVQAARDLAGVLAVLAERGARDVELLWTVNGATALVSADVARELAERPEVREVLADLPIVQLKPIRPAVAPAAGHTWGPVKVGAPQVWKDHAASGQGVTIGLIDTGVDGNHKDLAGRVVRFRNFTKITAPEEPAFDDEGHGTHCAGIIAGGDASGSAIGIAPKVRLIAAKGLDKNGSGGLVGLIRSLQWMTDPDGSSATHDQPIAVSCSWGANLNLPVVSRVFWLSISSLRDAGVLPVVASGNEGPGKLSVPGSYPHSMAVGATQENDTVADFTSRGTVKWGSTTYIKPNISAPGDFIYSSVPGNKYEYMSGTSMATPAVAGSVALIKSLNRNLTANQIESILLRSAKDLGAPGEDATFGRGLVNAKAAAVMVTGGGVPRASAPRTPPWERPAAE